MGVGVGMCVDVGDDVGVGIAVGTRVGVGVGVGTAVAVGMGVGVGCGVGVIVGVGAGVGVGAPARNFEMENSTTSSVLCAPSVAITLTMCNCASWSTGMSASEVVCSKVRNCQVSPRSLE